MGNANVDVQCTWVQEQYCC